MPPAKANIHLSLSKQPAKSCLLSTTVDNCNLASGQTGISKRVCVGCKEQRQWLWLVGKDKSPTYGNAKLDPQKVQEKNKVCWKVKWAWLNITTQRWKGLKLKKGWWGVTVSKPKTTANIPIALQRWKRLQDKTTWWGVMLRLFFFFFFFPPTSTRRSVTVKLEPKVQIFPTQVRRSFTSVLHVFVLFSFCFQAVCHCSKCTN